MRRVCSNHAMEWSEGCSTEEARSSAFGINGHRSMYPSVDKCPLIVSRLPKQRASPQVRNVEVPLSVCRSSVIVRLSVASRQRYTGKRFSSQSFRAQTTQATSHLAFATAMASGWFQWSEKEPGTENVKWKVADCKMCLLTQGKRGLKPSCCARHRSLLRYSA